MNFITSAKIMFEYFNNYLSFVTFVILYNIYIKSLKYKIILFLSHYLNIVFRV